MELASLLRKEKMTKITHTHYRTVSVIYIQGFVRESSLSLALFHLAETWLADFGNNQESAWGKSHRHREEKRKKIYIKRDVTFIRCDQRKNERETSSNYVHTGYFPSWYLYHDRKMLGRLTPWNKRPGSAIMACGTFTKICHYFC